MSGLKTLDQELPPGGEIHREGDDIQNRLAEDDPVRARQPDTPEIEKPKGHLLDFGERFHQRAEFIDQPVQIDRFPIGALEQAVGLGMGEGRAAGRSGTIDGIVPVLLPKHLSNLLEGPGLLAEELGFPDRQLVHRLRRAEALNVAQLHDPVRAPIRGL